MKMKEMEAEISEFLQFHAAQGVVSELAVSLLHIPPSESSLEEVLSALNQDMIWEDIYLLQLLLLRSLLPHPVLTEGEGARVEAGLDWQLEHEQVRVREAAARLSGEFCVCFPAATARVLARVIARFEEQLDGRQESVRGVVLGEQDTVQLDDTTGWASLETYQLTFLSLARSRVLQLEAPHCKAFLLQASTHTNRYIRQHAFETAALLFCSLSNLRAQDQRVQCLLPALCAGLQDNWCQVRLAATTAVSPCFMAIHRDDRLQCLKVVLPQLCLNRYYVTDSICRAANSAWKQIVGFSGKSLVQSELRRVVDFYCSMSTHSNHMVAEAAVFSINEVFAKMPFEVLEEHYSTLLHVMWDCLRDASWPIRDVAVTCISNIVTHNLPFFAMHVNSEDKALNLKDIVVLLMQHLKDPIRPVRENSAVSLLVIYDQLTSSEFDVVKSLLMNGIVATWNQNFKAVDKSSTPAPQFIPSSMLSSMLKANNAPLQLRKRPNSWGCCLDCNVEAEVKPFEKTEMCVFLLHAVATKYDRIAQPYFEDVEGSLKNLVGIVTAKTFQLRLHAIVQENLHSHISDQATMTSAPVQGEANSCIDTSMVAGEAVFAFSGEKPPTSSSEAGGYFA